MKDTERKPAFLLPALIILFLSTALLAYTVLHRASGFEFPRLLPDFGRLFVRTQTETAQDALLSGTRDLFQLNTVEYVYKTVFPFDYYSPSIDQEALRRRIRAAGPGKPVMSAAESDFLEAQKLAAEIGIGPARNPTGFLIVTAIVQAGYTEASGTADRGTGFSLSADWKNGSVTVAMPSPVITGIVIEDPESGAYRFPNVKMTPEHWKKLAAFISERIRLRVLEEGILRDAERQGRSMITAFLRQSGFSTITLSDPYF